MRVRKRENDSLNQFLEIRISRENVVHPCPVGNRDASLLNDSGSPIPRIFMYISENFSKKNMPSPLPSFLPPLSLIQGQPPRICIVFQNLRIYAFTVLDSPRISCCRFHASPTGEIRQVFRSRKRCYLSVGGKKRRKEIRRASTTGRRIIFKDNSIIFLRAISKGNSRERVQYACSQETFL